MQDDTVNHVAVVKPTGASVEFFHEWEIFTHFSFRLWCTIGYVEVEWATVCCFELSSQVHWMLSRRSSPYCLLSNTQSWVFSLCWILVCLWPLLAACGSISVRISILLCRICKKGTIIRYYGTAWHPQFPEMVFLVSKQLLPNARPLNIQISMPVSSCCKSCMWPRSFSSGGLHITAWKFP